MTRTCPKCENQSLSNAGRDAVRCPKCHGVFVPRGAQPELGEAAGPETAGSHDVIGGQCPVDHSIMSRAAVDLGGTAGTLHLERCSSCHGVWFDAGEWTALADRRLLEHLDEFWTAEWRTKQRRQQNQENHERRLAEEFGPELLTELRAIAEKLRGHERRSQALAFLKDASE
jgi:Zn-finger nucleic acid-binding protein